MKSERKQVLESNLLADKIEAIFVRVKALLPVILTVTGVLIGGLLIYGFYSSYQETQAAKAWTALYFSDTDTADLNSVSTEFGSSSAGLFAKQTAGDAYMAKALERIYLDRDLSDQYYKQAIDEYKVVAEKTTDSFLKERSLFGLAQAYEGLCDREKAIEHYRKVGMLSDIPPEFLVEVNKRISWLESKAGEQFYSWFKQNRPSAPVLNQGTPSKSPVPSVPNIDFPIVPKSDSGKAEVPNQPVEATATPATESTATPVEPPKPADRPDNPPVGNSPQVATEVRETSAPAEIPK